ncbi:MAG: Maf family nucleotide pyrophosphatase [Gammaproteobacteria bacterium]|nr:Maf family nucleotide pyrophosphatase [Gammaproteobacteria bacterium]MCW8982501.1 Maf family nucleotide pyrophosphatase [Gammaproteobacteria bacterium]
MIILASASPRRAELLQQIGVQFETHHADIDERLHHGEHAQDYVMRLALEKAQALSSDMAISRGLPVLGADTSVIIGDEVLGKPRDYEHFHQMMVKLSGTTHQVMTAVALIPPDAEPMSALSVSNVSFRHLQGSEIEAYWQSGEPVDKAGSYAIQGLGAIFIENMAGSYSGVMGLPLFETAQLLNRVGIATLEIDGESK